MMMNERGTLWCIVGLLFVLSITAAAYAQQDQQPDSALSQSQFLQIIEMKMSCESILWLVSHLNLNLHRKAR